MEYKCEECGTPLRFEGLCWKCRAKKHRKEVDNWSTQEMDARKQIVIEKLKSSNEDEFYTTDEHDLFNDLMTKGIDCKEIARTACEKEIYYPSELYYKADGKISDILIEKLIATESANEGANILRCLAMIGDKRAQETLYELKKNPRPWRKQLYVDSDIYAEEGGWSFDKDGKRLELNFDICYPLTEGCVENSPVRIGRIREDFCTHCGGKMVDILVLDGKDKRLKFLGVEGIITATCCPNCVGFLDGPAFNRFSLDGKSEIIRSKLFDNSEHMECYMRKEEYDLLANNNFTLAESNVPVFYGAFSDDVNTIGGFANWIQDWEYKECPICGKKMKYLAQIHWDTITDGAEGTLFIEICTDCKIIAMIHQQT